MLTEQTEHEARATGRSPLRRASAVGLRLLILIVGIAVAYGGAQDTNKGRDNTAATFVASQLRLGKKPNRLIHEKSPYLLQHSFNPVDWYPWGNEAFAKARQENKLIFLSVGYSTCYWCHVMERQVFEKDEIAALMNRYFVNIKVDREERPDVDRIYMNALQAMTGGGGWPMSLLLTPDLKPFFGGSYIPPERFRELIGQVDGLWKSDPEKLRTSSRQIIEVLRQSSIRSASAVEPGNALLRTGFDQFRQSYDKQNGGFGSRPKFPRPVTFNFLLRYHSRFGEKEVLPMALATLQKMRRGGVYDHIGGGFHRYSVDAEWRVPHFEKMLYDQAQLVLAYLEATQATGDPFFAAVAEDTLDYVVRDLTDPAGGFYSAEDADSAPAGATLDERGRVEKVEGAFYVFTAAEIDALMGEDAPVIRRRFGVEENGNALADPQGEFRGHNLLYVAQTIEEVAARTGRDVESVMKVLRRARKVLFDARSARPRPHLDDKV